MDFRRCVAIAVAMVIVVVSAAVAGVGAPRVGAADGDPVLVTGHLTESQIWTAESGPYVISNTAWVDAGVQLTVAAGAQVNFDDDARLIVRGQFVVHGAEGNPAVFSSSQSQLRGAWDTIRIQASADQGPSVINWGDFSYGGGGPNGLCHTSGMVDLFTGELTVANSVFRYSADSGVVARSGQSLTVTGSWFSESKCGVTTGKGAVLGNYFDGSLETSLQFGGVRSEGVDVHNNYLGAIARLSAAPDPTLVNFSDNDILDGVFASILAAPMMRQNWWGHIVTFPLSGCRLDYPEHPEIITIESRACPLPGDGQAADYLYDVIPALTGPSYVHDTSNPAIPPPVNPGPPTPTTPTTTTTTTPPANEDTERPGKASSLTVVANGADAVLGWSAATDNVGIAGYQVWRATANRGPATVVGTSATTSFTDPGLADGTYWYYLRAFDATGNVGWRTGYKSVDIGDAGVDVDTERPTKPRDLNVTAEGPDAVLGWSAGTDNVAVTGYQVWRATEDRGAATLVGTSPTTDFTDTDLEDGTWWYFLKSYDAAGNISWRTGYKSVAIGEAGGELDTERPGKASGLNIIAQETDAALSWSAATDNVGVAGYQIWRATEDRGEAVLAGTSATTAFIDEGLPDGTYWYYIKAFDDAGNVGWRTGYKSVRIIEPFDV